MCGKGLEITPHMGHVGHVIIESVLGYLEYPSSQVGGFERQFSIRIQAPELSRCANVFEGVIGKENGQHK
jgi:hypothetical protein